MRRTRNQVRRAIAFWTFAVLASWIALLTIALTLSLQGTRP